MSAITHEREIMFGVQCTLCHESRMIHDEIWAMTRLLGVAGRIMVVTSFLVVIVLIGLGILDEIHISMVKSDYERIVQEMRAAGFSEDFSRRYADSSPSDFLPYDRDYGPYGADSDEYSRFRELRRKHNWNAERPPDPTLLTNLLVGAVVGVPMFLFGYYLSRKIGIWRCPGCGYYVNRLDVKDDD